MVFPQVVADRAIGDRPQGYGHMGVHLGLDRIRTLLAALGNPHQQVPILHVAGTNGKGSVCAYLSAVLTAAGYRVGRYTSPHLVSWCERITVEEAPIPPEELMAVLDQVAAAIDPDQELPTQFEVFTAAAWLHFAQQRVDVAVIEVGLGGRLDATNVVADPVVTVITSIGRDHWQQLGPTLADIAREKAGILKPGRPAIIGPLPPEAAAVVAERVAAVGCPAQWPAPAVPVGTTQAQVGALRYPWVLPGEHQLVNSALAIAAIQSLQAQGWMIPPGAIVAGMAQVRWPGRLQWLSWRDDQGQGHPLLVDGAHNGPAAAVLRAYVDRLFPAETPPLTWVMGMLATKDHGAIFSALLRSGDHLHLVPVPDHLTAAPPDLATLAQEQCLGLATCHCYPDLATALAAASPGAAPFAVLAGSLYLIGHGFATLGDRLQPIPPPFPAPPSQPNADSSPESESEDSWQGA